jgi:hypothetical protein
MFFAIKKKNIFLLKNSTNIFMHVFPVLVIHSDKPILNILFIFLQLLTIFIESLIIKNSILVNLSNIYILIKIFKYVVYAIRIFCNRLLISNVLFFTFSNIFFNSQHILPLQKTKYGVTITK